MVDPDSSPPTVPEELRGLFDDLRNRCARAEERADRLSEALAAAERKRSEAAQRESAEKSQAHQLHKAQTLDAVARLAGGVAHDINNLLTVIESAVDLARPRVDRGDAVHELLDEISGAAQRSGDLARRLLAFARRQESTPRVVDLNDMVDRMLRMLRRLVGDDRELRWAPSSDLWPVCIDPTQVDQILANLCVNARDATRSGGRVLVETRNEPLADHDCAGRPGFQPGDWVCLRVRDDGCGMDAATQERIFEPFFTTKPEGKGTGLGLATVYGVVRQNQGFVHVESAPGMGSTFAVYLPRVVGEPEREAPREPCRERRQGRESVLLVEDDPTVLRLVRRLLESLGYSVLAAPSGQEALRLFEGAHGGVDLLVTDLIMPGMGGRELAERLRLVEPALRCLYMSGYTVEFASKGAVGPRTAFIQKPFAADQLAARLHDLLELPA